jgi:transposase
LNKGFSRGVINSMATRMLSIDRNTAYLLPPDVRDWVPENDLSHFLVDALETLDLTTARVNERGSGSEQYPPSMMLLLLIYCYAQGIFSSRKIEQATYLNVAVRYLCANTNPDHDTIATFRRQNGALLRTVFAQVLQLAKATGLVNLGAVSIDGTKFAAATHKRRTLSYEQLQAQTAHWDKEIDKLLAQAEKADQQGSDQSQLPKALADAQARRARLREAKAQLEEQSRQRHEQREKERAQAKGQPGNLPRKLKKEAQPKDRINLTDPDSRLMPTAQGPFVQGYNAQAAVALEGGLIVATEVVQETTDLAQLSTMVGKCVENGCRLRTAVADKGYYQTRELMAAEQQHGVTVFCPPHRMKRRRFKSKRRNKRDQARRHVRLQMMKRLESPAGQRLIKLRATTVEPVFGTIKQTIGFQRFLLRGLEKVRLEWTLVSLAFNCRKLARSWKR